MGVRLPAEYQEVEWIQTVRDQSYLDIPLGRIRFPYFKCQLCSPTQESWSGLNFVDANSSFDFAIDRKSASDPTFRFFANGQGYVMTNQSVYLPGVAEYRGADGLLVNGISAGNFFLSDKYATELFIGRYRTNIRQTRLWYCKLYDANQTILDLVPCYRKSDDEPGMYDLVSGEFFTNAGTGEFAVGPDVIDSISPWLVARRRMLMRKPPLDTSPKIAEYGKVLDRAATGVINDSKGCYTEWYDVQEYTDSNVLITNISSAYYPYQYERKNVNPGWWYGSDRNVGMVTRIRFSILNTELTAKTSYAYSGTTGEVFFADRNSPYWGKKNIND